MTHKKSVENEENSLVGVKYVSQGNGKDEELKPVKSSHVPDTFFLYFAVFTGQMLIMVNGTAVVWTSPAITILKSTDPEVNPIGRPITTTEISMLAGLPGLISLICNILPPLANVIGRKMYLQIMGGFVCLSGILLAFCNDVLYLTILRCIQAIALGGAWAVVPIYVTEICEDHNKAKFGCFFGLIHQIGHFMCFILGPLVNLRNLTMITTAPGILFLAFSLIMPESLFYLASKGKTSECKKVLRKLRNNKTEEELEVDYNLIQITANAKTKGESSGMLSLFTERENRIAVILATLPLTVQYCSGVVAIMSFLAPFLDSADTGLSGSYAAIIVSVVKISCFSFTMCVVEKFGTRTMLLISSFGTCIFMGSIGIFFFLKHINSPLIDYLQWLPLVGVISIIITYSIGLGPIPIAIMNEFFPTHLRAAASCFINIFLTIITFVVTFSFPLIVDNFGAHWCVWIFSSCCFVGGFLIYFYLPETKGKSFIEMQEILRKY